MQRTHRPATALGIVLAVAGCASGPPPTTELAAARQAITDAERAQAREYAAEELTQARLKLDAANDAVEDEDMDAARRYAEEARADAVLAAARTSAAKAQSANEEIRRSQTAVMEEMQRPQGGTP
jgi:hypothetical protein